jgi:hypothetical protein
MSLDSFKEITIAIEELEHKGQIEFYGTIIDIFALLL